VGGQGGGVGFDLTANLTFYGPGPGGKGQVGQAGGG
jgi:hypothetical protein